MQNFPKYLTEREVSEFTRIGMKTLQQHRWKNTGIPYHKFGGTVRYSEEDVLQYMKNCRVETEIDRLVSKTKRPPHSEGKALGK